MHSFALLDYGHSVAKVREYIESVGYHIDIIAVDTEEHWRCVKDEKK